MQIETEQEQLEAFRDREATVTRPPVHAFRHHHPYHREPDGSSRVTMDCNGLKLSVQFGDKRSTPATKSLKKIAFNLAVGA